MLAQLGGLCLLANSNKKGGRGGAEKGSPALALAHYSECTTTTQRFSRPFERARASHGALAARDLSAAATPLARRPLAMSHRTGAPLERGEGGGTEVLALCHPPSPRSTLREDLLVYDPEVAGLV